MTLALSEMRWSSVRRPKRIGNGTCTAANFTTTDWLAATTADDVVVPANTTGYVVPAAARPKIKLLNLASNQDNCKGKSFTLTYGGQAGDHA